MCTECPIEGKRRGALQQHIAPETQRERGKNRAGGGAGRNEKGGNGQDRRATQTSRAHAGRHDAMERSHGRWGTRA
eukprot:2912893-Alexandrium_andersonii.AAC.1